MAAEQASTPTPPPSPPAAAPATTDAAAKAKKPKKPKKPKPQTHDEEGRPLTGYLHPKAPKLDLPKEAMELIYRQTLLFMGMIISPWLFLIGFLSNIGLYWIKYAAVYSFHARPKKMEEYFSAGTAVRDFYAFFLLSTMLSFIPFAIYITLPTNPMCGPLRSIECAEGFYEGNITACVADTVDKRPNFEVLSSVLMPSASETLDLGALMTVGGNATGLPSEGCDVECIFKNIVALVVRVPVLLGVILLLVIAITFLSAQALRSTNELREAKKELSLEYQEKKKALRHANVEL